MILRIAGEPARNYYQTPSDRAYLPSKEANHDLLIQPSPLRTTALGETSNLTVLLNQSALRYMTIPPLGALAVLSDAGVTLHSGRVISASWNPEGLSLEVEP